MRRAAAACGSRPLESSLGSGLSPEERRGGGAAVSQGEARNLGSELVEVFLCSPQPALGSGTPALTLGRSLGWPELRLTASCSDLVKAAETEHWRACVIRSASAGCLSVKKGTTLLDPHVNLRRMSCLVEELCDVVLL